MVKSFFQKYSQFFVVIAFVLLGNFIVFFGPFFSKTILTGDYTPVEVEISRSTPFLQSVIFIPYSLAGFRTLGQNLYFFSYLLHKLPTNLAINFHFFFVLFFSAIFMYYALSKLGLNFYGALMGGLAYAFSGSYGGFILSGNINKLDSFMWAPLVFICVYQAFVNESWEWAAFGGLFAGLMFLAGEPQATYYFLFLLLFLVFFLGEKRTFKQTIKNCLLFFLVIVLAGLVSAVAIFTFYFDLGHYFQAAGISQSDYKSVYEFKTAYSFPPEEFLIFFFSNLFFGGNSGEGYWGRVPFRVSDDYLGIIGLIFVIFSFFSKSKRKIFYYFIFSFVFAVLISFGKYNPLYQFFYKLPLMSMGRNPHRWLLPAVFFWSGLVGIGGHFLKEESKIFAKKNLIKILIVLGIVWAILSVILFLVNLSKNGGLILVPKLWPENLPEFVRIFRLNMIRQAVLKSFILFSCGFLIVFFIFFGQREKFRIFFVYLLLFLLLSDLTFNLRRFVRYFEKIPLPGQEQLVKFFKNDSDFYRVKLFFLSRDLAPFFTSLFRENKIFCYDAIFSTLPGDYNFFWSNLKNELTFFKLLNIKYLVTDFEVNSKDFFEKVMDAKVGNFKVYVYNFKKFLPRFFWIKQEVFAKDDKEVFMFLNNQKFQPENEVVLEDEAKKEKPIKNLEKAFFKMPKVVKYTNDMVELDVTNSPGAFLFFGDVFDPYWKVEIDGQKTKIYRANYLFRAVFVPYGSQKLIFKFCPPSFGKWVTIFSLFFYFLLCIYLIFKSYGRNRKR